MTDFSLAFSTNGLREDIREITVHVPLNIRDICRREHIAHSLYQVILDFFIGEVQYHLVPAFRMLLSGYLHRPFRMRSVKLAVAVYHLRLNPDAELKAEFADFVADAFYAVWKFFLIGIPVT